MNTKLEITNWNADAAFTLIPQKGCESGWKRFSNRCLEAFRKLEEKVSNELETRFAAVRPERVRQAVNEAAALATTTAFPSLFLPTLAEEKVLLASDWQMKQRVIQDRAWLRAA